MWAEKAKEVEAYLMKNLDRKSALSKKTLRSMCTTCGVTSSSNSLTHIHAALSLRNEQVVMSAYHKVHIVHIYIVYL